jgi:Skp family chaperone for outer membrane proteins
MSQSVTSQKPEQVQSPNKMGFSALVLSCFSVIIAVFISLLLAKFLFTPKIAYVDTSKLMLGFSEANKVEREIKAEDDKWKDKLKTMQDSLKASIDTMSKYYDISKPAQKKALQDNLSALNQRVNSLRRLNGKIIQVDTKDFAENQESCACTI